MFICEIVNEKILFFSYNSVHIIMSNGFQNTWRVGTLDCYPKFSGETDYVFTVHWDCLAYYSGISGGAFYGRTYSCTAIPPTTGDFIPYESLTEPLVLNWVWEQIGEEQKNQYESGAMQQIYNQLVPPVVQPPLPWPNDVFPIIAPSISNQPTNVSGYLGSDALFVVNANGQPLYYQWRKDSVNIPAATGSIYNISGIKQSDAGFYDVNIYNSTGNIFSDPASLTILPTPTGI